MNRPIAITVASFAFLTVAACSAGSESDGSSESTPAFRSSTNQTTATPAAIPTPTLAPNVAKFVGKARELDSFSGGDDKSISAFGLYACSALASADSLGDGLQTIFTFMSENEINATPEDIADATGFAVGTLCPENADMLAQ